MTSRLRSLRVKGGIGKPSRIRTLDDNEEEDPSHTPIPIDSDVNTQQDHESPQLPDLGAHPIPHNFDIDPSQPQLPIRSTQFSVFPSTHSRINRKHRTMVDIMSEETHPPPQQAPQSSTTPPQPRTHASSSSSQSSRQRANAPTYSNSGSTQSNHTNVNPSYSHPSPQPCYTQQQQPHGYSNMHDEITPHQNNHPQHPASQAFPQLPQSTHDSHLARPSSHRGSNELHVTRQDHTMQPRHAQQPTHKLLPQPQDDIQTTNSFTVITINTHQYTLLNTLGKGGSGKVYFALKSSTGERFAIKEVILNDDLNHIDAIQEEIGLLQRLSAPNSEYRNRIVKLIDFQYFFEKKVCYIVLELAGKDLGTVLHQHLTEHLHTLKNAKKTNEKISQNLLQTIFPSGLTLSQICYYWEQVLLCVDACHSMHILHLDLKPSNFVFVDGGWLKLIDFGIAKAKSIEMTSVVASNIVGTVSYMSPEHFACMLNSNETRNELENSSVGDQEQEEKSQTTKLRTSSDVWALGCLFHQMVYGFTPYADQHKNIHSRITAISSPIPFIPQPIVLYDLNNKQDGTDDDDPQRYILSLITDVLQKSLQKAYNHRATVKELLKHPLLSANSRFNSFGAPTTPNTPQIDEILIKKAVTSLLHEQAQMYRNKQQQSTSLTISGAPNTANMLPKDMNGYLITPPHSTTFVNLLTQHLNETISSKIKKK